MTVQTADISNTCEYSWYEWVIFRDQLITYPDSPVILEHYLGPAIDVGSAMTYNYFESKRQACVQNFFFLNSAELSCSQHKQLWDEFDASVAESLGPAATISDFDYKEYTDLTPDIDYYDNFDEDGSEVSPDDSPSLPATSEVNDWYFNVGLVLPRGSDKARGHVTKHSRDNLFVTL